MLWTTSDYLCGGEGRGEEARITIENPGIKICWKKTTETDRIWADKPVSSALQKMGEFFNISNSYSPSISLTTPWISATRTEVSTRQAQATPDVRRVEGKRTWLHGQMWLVSDATAVLLCWHLEWSVTPAHLPQEVGMRPLAPADPQAVSPFYLLSRQTVRQERKRKKKSLIFKNLPHSFMEGHILKVWPWGTRFSCPLKHFIKTYIMHPTAHICQQVK